MTTTVERLWEATRTLTEPMLAEVLDFAEFLRTKQARTDSKPVDADLASLCGGLEQSKTFSGSPLIIQQELRNEWR